MVKTLLNTALLSAIGFSSIASAQSAFSVNGQTISVQSQNDLIASLAAQGMTDPTQQLIAARNLLTERAVVAQEVHRLQLDQKPAVREKLDNSKHGIYLEALGSEYLQGKSPTGEELDKIYEDIKAEYDPNFIQISQIVVKTEPEAKDIIRKLNEGGNFEELAKELSLDPQAKLTAGQLPLANAKSYQVPGLAPTALSVAEGVVVQSPFKANADEGWLVVRVDKKEVRPVPEKDSITKQIEEIWKRQTLNNYFIDLVKQAKVVDSPSSVKK